MPQSANVSTQNNFIKGLITEATGLTFPENAATDTDNCVYDQLGEVSRRLGFDFEGLRADYIDNLTDKVVVNYLWNNVGGIGDDVFVVAQTGDLLHFYRVSPDLPLSASKHADTIDLTTFLVTGVASVADRECQFSSGNGRLFVTNRKLNTFYVEYDSVGDSFSATVIDLQIRDLEGDLTDALAVDERPTSDLASLTSAHEYNLLNQGWTNANLVLWDTARTDMPSNADISWLFKDADNAFDFTTVDDRLIGNSRAARGHFIYSVYDIDRSSHVVGATDFEIEDERVTTSAFHAGRVFYAGLRVPSHSSRIYFTQIIEEPSQYGKCYQHNDLTSESFFALLPSDGGVIDIIDAGNIIKMIPMMNALIVFASNGIWTITGSQGIGFTANDYSINRLSTITNISHTSFVDVEGSPYWWNADGIYTITSDKQTNALRAVSVTDKTIRKLYLAIPAETKLYARGAYDPFLKEIHWVYRNAEADTIAERYTFDRCLIMNTNTGAFYPWSVSSANVRIHSVINVVGLGGLIEPAFVVDGEDEVMSDEDEVITFDTGSRGPTAIIKYYISFTPPAGAERTTFAENFDPNNRDWTGYDAVGEQYDSYFVTGYAVRGKGINRFQNNYVSVISKTETSTSYKIEGRWDYATSGNTGRWSSSQLCIANADGYAYKANRIRIRGHGLACQFKIYNNDRNPFNIVGWSVYETGNQKP